jgi:hypothetical protein
MCLQCNEWGGWINGQISPVLELGEPLELVLDVRERGEIGAKGANEGPLELVGPCLTLHLEELAVSEATSV